MIGYAFACLIRFLRAYIRAAAMHSSAQNSKVKAKLWPAHCLRNGIDTGDVPARYILNRAPLSGQKGPVRNYSSWLTTADRCHLGANNRTETEWISSGTMVATPRLLILILKVLLGEAHFLVPVHV